MKLEESEVTEHNSLLLTRSLLGIAVSNISYLTGLFPKNYFIDQFAPASETKIKKLMPIDAESRSLIDWMEKCVYDSLQKKYLKTLLFCICKAVDGPVIEEYAFLFSYSNSEIEEITMNINHTGNKKQGATFKSNDNTYTTSSLMRSSAYEMVRTIVQLMQSPYHMPEERSILMKLLCYEDVTPIDYEPPFFRGCSEQEANHPWLKSPPKMESSNVNSKHFVLALKICESWTGTTTVAFYFDNGRGALLAADTRGTKEGLVAATDAYKIKILGSTRACTLAGNNKIIGDIVDIIEDQLKAAEKSNTELESVKQSADYVHKYFGSKKERPHVEMLIVGWDTMKKEGAPVIWYGNHLRPSLVKKHRATGSGRNYAPLIMDTHEITMNQKQTVEIAEKTILETAQCDWKTGDNIDILIVKDGKFEWMPRQKMEDIAKKYGVPVEALKQTPD